MNNATQKGLLTELECELAFARLGFAVLKPISDNYRYDYVIDLGNKFIRVQCKSSITDKDKKSITFNSVSTYSNRKKSVRKHYTKKEIDYFYTCYENKSYLIPVELVNTGFTLRLSIENAHNKSHLAKDFELEKILIENEKIKPQTIRASVPFINTKPQKCKKCNAPISDGATYCKKCIKEIEKEKSRIKFTTRNKLKEEIRKMPIIKVGEKYGVTDNAIRKWCKKFGLPSKKSDINSYSDEEWEMI